MGARAPTLFPAMHHVETRVRHRLSFFRLPIDFSAALFSVLRAFAFWYRKGDCSKAKKELGWVPEITFQELVKDMMKSDIANVDAGNDHA